MTPVNYIRIDLDVMKMKKSDKAKMLLGLIKSFNSKGLMMSNPDLANLLDCSADYITKLLKEIGKNIKIINPQSRYRKIFYSGENNGVDEGEVRPKVRSKENSTPSNRPATPSISTPTPSKSTDKIKKKKKNKIYTSDSNEYRLAELLLSLIRERKPDYRKIDLQKWAKHIDLMLRIDKRKPEDVENVIHWCQQNDFWQNNILSTDKLRNQFDQLQLKMKENPGKYKCPPVKRDENGLTAGEKAMKEIQEAKKKRQLEALRKAE